MERERIQEERRIEIEKAEKRSLELGLKKSKFQKNNIPTLKVPENFNILD